MQIQDVPWDQKHDQSKIIGTDVSQKTYENTPVSQFGNKMLSMMGWHEGRGVGKSTTNNLLKPVESVKRPAFAGLGSIQGERAFKTIGEKEKPQGIQKFTQVMIISGKYKSLQAVVLELTEKDALVQLIINDANVRVNKDQIVDVKDIELKSRSRSKSKEQSNLKWICSGIQVKMKNKKNKNYNKKIQIQDIIDDNHFLALLPDGSLVDDLLEDDLKPYIPNQGSRVKILTGKHKGRIGVLGSKQDKRYSVILDGEQLQMKKKEICGICNVL